MASGASGRGYSRQTQRCFWRQQQFMFYRFSVFVINDIKKSAREIFIAGPSGGQAMMASPAAAGRGGESMLGRGSTPDDFIDTECHDSISKMLAGMPVSHGTSVFASRRRQMVMAVEVKYRRWRWYCCRPIGAVCAYFTYWQCLLVGGH